MKTDDGTLSFGTAIDMSGFDEGVKQMEQKFEDVTSTFEVNSAKINELLNNIPVINIDVVTNASQSLEEIQQGFDEIDFVFEANKAAIKELEKEYGSLSEAMKKAQAKGDTTAVAKYKEEIAAIKENIAIRKKVIEKTGETADSLAKVEERLRKEADEAKKSEAAHISFRQRIRELKEEMVAMEQAGQRNTEKYRQIQAECTKLTDAWKDATNQANRLAHDQAGMQGIVSGLSGLSGGFMAASSAVSLFAGENEDLQKVMLKVQQLMSITMGLQQLQATLDKDSAFRIVTLNGLKEWWAKLLAIGTGEMVAETAATNTNTAAELGNAAATEADAAAKEHEAAASGKAAVSETADTGAKIANTGAAVAGKVANIGLAGAFRMVGAAIKSIPVFGWIAAAFGVLMGVLSHFRSKAKEAKEAAKELREMMHDANKAYLTAKVGIQQNIDALTNFNGTKRQEKKLIEDLNTKYGETLGYHQSRAEWLDVLKKKGEAYCQTMLMEAQAQAYLNKYTEAYIKLQDTKQAVKDGEYKRWWSTTSGDAQRGQNAIQDARKDVDKWEKEYKKLMSEIDKFKRDNEIDFHPKPTVDPVKAALEIKKSLDEYKKYVKQFIKDANNEISNLTLESMEDSLSKELMASRLATDRRLDAWEKQMKELGAQRKALLKAQYMNQDGATEEGWANSAAGKKTDVQYAREILAEGGAVAKKMYAQRALIVENGENEIQKITQKYNDALIDEFGTKEQKIEKLEREWNIRMINLPREYWSAAERKMAQEIQAITQEWVDKYGDYRQKRLAVIKKYQLEEEELYEDDTVKRDAEGNITAGTFKAGVSQNNVDELQRQRDEALAAIDEEIASRDASYQRWLNEISEKTIKELKELLKTAQKALENLEKDPNADPQQLAVARALVRQLDREIQNASLSPTEENIEQWRKYSLQLDEVGQAMKGLGDEMGGVAGQALSMLGTIMSSTSTMIKSITDLTENCMKAMESGAKTASKAIAAASSAVAILAIIQAIYTAVTELRDFIDDNFDTDSGFGQFISDFLHYLTDSETMLENLAWSLLGPVGTLIGMLNSSNKNSDRKKHAEEIKNLVKAYDELNDQLEQLERQAGQTFGATNAEIRQQQIELKKLMIANLEARIAEEKSQKKPDNDKIEEWENTIHDLQNDIYDLEIAAEDAIFGEGIKTAIENFGNALADAWANGTSASEAANNYVRDMIKKTVMQAILDYTQASTKIDQIRQKIKNYLQNDGIISDDEQADIEDMAQDLMDEVGEQFEWARHLFDGGRNAGARGIATASQESVDENNARLTTIQGHTYSLVQGMNDLNTTGTQILARLTGIEHNTGETNDKLDAMNVRMKRIDDSLDTMQRQGIMIKT